MNREVRREVVASEQFLDRLDYYFGDGYEGRPSTHEVLLNRVIPHIFEAFAEMWPGLPLVDPSQPRTRYYRFHDDEIPMFVVVGRLISVRDEAASYRVEQIELSDLIIRFLEEPLEDPDDPTPNR